MAIGRPISLTPNVKSKNISVKATASQTAFTVEGGYRINQIQVFRNGVRLSQGSDYTASDGSVVTLLSAATLDDVIAFQIFDTFAIVDAIIPDSSDQTINGNITITGSGDVSGDATVGGALTVTGPITGLSSVTGAAVGIQSAGTVIGTAQTFNFVGSGNTFADNGDGTIDITISGSGGGGLGVAVDDVDGIFSYINKYATVTADITLDTSNAGVNTSIVVTTNPVIEVETGVAVTVGAGKTLVIDVLQINDLYEP